MVLADSARLHAVSAMLRCALEELEQLGRVGAEEAELSSMLQAAQIIARLRAEGREINRDAFALISERAENDAWFAWGLEHVDAFGITAGPMLDADSANAGLGWTPAKLRAELDRLLGSPPPDEETLRAAIDRLCEPHAARSSGEAGRRGELRRGLLELLGLEDLADDRGPA